MANRILRATARVVAVMCLGASAGRAAAEEAPPGDPGADIRRVERSDHPLPERLAAAQRLLDRAELPADRADALARAALRLLPAAEGPSLWLLLRAVDAGSLDPETGGAALAGLRAAPPPAAGAPQAEAALASRAAAAFLLGVRTEEAAGAMLAVWPPPEFVAAVARREGPWPPDAGGGDPLRALAAADVRATVASQLPVLRDLDRAASADAAEARAGLDALLAAGERALPTLLHEAAAGADGCGAGRLPRVTRAVCVLGLLGDRRATPVLERALLDAPSGWVRVAAATALGDLGDPAAAPTLCRQLVYRGDVFRPRDAWEYPGAGETSVPEDQWASIEYFATDCAAADALLRMGVANAAGWLLRNALDPAKASYRVRVLQDATDALRRSVPGIPVAAYNPDAGVPARRAALAEMNRWWEAHRHDAGVTRATFPEGDPGYVQAARQLAEAFHGRKVMELLIAQDTAAVLGRSLTPTLLADLATATSPLHRGELARALGTVEDPRAVPALRGLLGDRSPSVRSVAAESLGAYLEGSDEVRDALVALLDDPDSGPRVSALKSLTAAAPSAVVRAALAAHPHARHEGAAGAGEDREYRIAETVALLVQEGEAHWPAVRAGLAAPERYVRRQWWDLLRRAVRAPDGAFDALADPGVPGWVPPDEAAILGALRARRGP